MHIYYQKASSGVSCKPVLLPSGRPMLCPLENNTTTGELSYFKRTEFKSRLNNWGYSALEADHQDPSQLSAAEQLKAGSLEEGDFKHKVWYQLLQARLSDAAAQWFALPDDARALAALDSLDEASRKELSQVVHSRDEKIIAILKGVKHLPSAVERISQVTTPTTPKAAVNVSASRVVPVLFSTSPEPIQISSSSTQNVSKTQSKYRL